MNAWTPERVVEQKAICSLNTDVHYSLKYIEAAKANYADALAEIERLQGELKTANDGADEIAKIAKKLRGRADDADVNASALLARIAELDWKQYIEDDPKTYPKIDGGMYEIIFVNEPGISYGHEFYFFNDGWATDKEIKYYRVTPPVPEEGE
jgi:hypothetical protein